MIIKIKRKQLKQAGFVLFSVLAIFVALLGVSMVTESVFAGNTTNQTVRAKVNVSNTEPTLYKVKIEYPLNSLGNIDLQAGNATTVICNGSFSDPNGFADIIGVNATLFFSTVGSNAADDKNNHYTNASCLSSGQACTQITGQANNGSCLCQFAVQYFANPGSWNCNMTINDSGGLRSTIDSGLVNVDEILGITVESLSLDYGNLSVSQVSNPIRQNVTNAGNININVTLRGFGGDDETVGENLTMICDPSVSLANITFGNQRFDTKNDTAFGNMFNLTNTTRQIFNLTIPQRTVDNSYGNSSNSTFWRLQIPLGASGLCNGTIIFGAIDAVNK